MRAGTSLTDAVWPAAALSWLVVSVQASGPRHPSKDTVRRAQARQMVFAPEGPNRLHDPGFAHHIRPKYDLADDGMVRGYRGKDTCENLIAAHHHPDRSRPAKTAR